MLLKEFIKTNFKSQAEFARLMEVTPQTVTRWINAGWLVVGDQLCSPFRKIPNEKD